MQRRGVATRADEHLVDTQKLVANTGISTLFQWTGIPRLQGAALLGASPGVLPKTASSRLGGTHET